MKCGIVEEAAFGCLDTAGDPIFAPFSKAHPGFFNTFVAYF